MPYKNLNEFKAAFINLELKDTNKYKLNTSFILPVNTLHSFVPKALLTGGITNFSAKFNKRIQDKNNYDQLVKKDKYKAYLATKFNARIVKQATLLKDTNQINSFMKYCDFTDQLIEFSSHYKIVDQIVNCFDENTNLPIENK